jgi:hypothetical protein
MVSLRVVYEDRATGVVYLIEGNLRECVHEAMHVLKDPTLKFRGIRAM